MSDQENQQMADTGAAPKLTAPAELLAAVEAADNTYFPADIEARGARAALAELEKGLARWPESFDLLWRLARCCFWISDRSEDAALKREYGAKGAAYAEKAMNRHPARIEGHYYYTLCIGEYGRGLSIPVAILQGIEKKFLAQAEIAVTIDRMFDRTGPLLALGRFYYVLPWPKRSLSKSIEYLRLALSLRPTARGYFYLAESYIDTKKWKEARETLTALEQMAIDQISPHEHQWFVNHGQLLLDKLGSKGR